jgi:hypothetical protein
MHNWRIIDGKLIQKRNFNGPADVWSSATTAWGAFEMVDGEFKVKAEYQDAIGATEISNINNEIRAIATDIDGQLSTTDKAAISQNI